jgi:Domain of unknown function (DUF6268)
MPKKIVVVVIVFISLKSLAQSSELFNVEFGSFGKKDDAVGINYSAVAVNTPVRFYNGILINGLSYIQYDLNYDSSMFMNTSSIKNFKTLKYNLSYIKSLSNKWAYMLLASPTLSSNFESSVSMDDLSFNGGLIFTKSNLKSKLNFGVIYNTAMGFKIPIPFLKYSRKMNDKLSYDLGFPITKINYKIDDRNKVNLYLKPKGFYSNISNKLVLDNSEIAKKANYQSFITGVNYLHRINDLWIIALDAGYQLSSKYDLLDKNKNSVYNFETKNSLYLGLNLKLNLLKNKNRKL